MNGKVTVGIPVYNGAKTLRRAVDCVLAQTHKPYRVVISDDGSTDATPAVGQALAAEYGITFFRQPGNLGPPGNFRFLLQQSDTEYFMWLAADDYLEPTYIERTLAKLEASPAVVACGSRVRFVAADGTATLSRGSYSLASDPATNLAVYFSYFFESARFYALHRTAVLKRAFPTSDYHAFDLTVCAGTLLAGTHHEIPEVLSIRDHTPRDNYIRAVRVDNRSWVSQMFPLLPLTIDLLVRLRAPRRVKVLKALLYANVEKHLEYMEFAHPAYMRMTKRFWRCWFRYVHWRLRTPFPPDLHGGAV